MIVMIEYVAYDCWWMPWMLMIVINSMALSLPVDSLKWRLVWHVRIQPSGQSHAFFCTSRIPDNVSGSQLLDIVAITHTVPLTVLRGTSKPSECDRPLRGGSGVPYPHPLRSRIIKTSNSKPALLLLSHHDWPGYPVQHGPKTLQAQSYRWWAYYKRFSKRMGHNTQVLL